MKKMLRYLIESIRETWGRILHPDTCLALSIAFLLGAITDDKTSLFNLGLVFALLGFRPRKDYSYGRKN